MNSAHSHLQGVSSLPGEGGGESSMTRRHRHIRSGGSIGSRRRHASETDDAPILICTGTDDNSETNSPTKIFSHPPLCNNNYDSSDEYRDAESTSSEKMSELDRRRRRIQIEAQLMNDCWETNLSDEDSVHEATHNIQLHQQKGEQDLLDEMLPKMDLQITSSTSSSDIKPMTSTSSNESVMSLPEQILQQRLQRKPKLLLQHKNNYAHFVRYDSRSPEQRRKALHAGYKCDAPLGSPPFAEDDEAFENDYASTVASSNGATSNVFSDLRRKLKLHENDHQLDAEDSSSPLASLPQRPICRFPEEADRKRIIGCLAIVLASSYAYETAPHLLVKEEVNDISARVDGSDVEGSDRSTFPSEKFAQQHDIDTNGDTDCNGDLVSEDESCGTSSHPHLQQHKKQQHLIEQSRKQKNKSTNHAAKKPPPASNSFSFNTNAASRIFDKVGSQNPPPSLTTELAEIRHRIRRHAILSELLISSAEMLMLDPSHAKAFLPMLDGLLTNVASSNASTDRSGHENVNNFDGTNKQSWKGRGFGGGGFAVAANMGDEEIIYAPSSRPTTSISDIPPRMTQPNQSSSLSSISDVVIGGSSTNAVPKQSSTNSMHDEGRGLKIIDTNELHPSSSRVKLSANDEECSNPNRPAPAYAPLDTVIIEGDLAAPFLQTLTPGAGFRCIALLLLNHLLRDGRGYDARVRHAFKRLAVIVISHELKVGGILCLDLDDEEDLDALLWGEKKTQLSGENESLRDADELALLATRKFEALEHAVAARLISLSRDSDVGAQTANARSHDHKQSPRVKRTERSASSLSSSTHGRIALAPKETPSPSQYGMSREQILRGIKVGTAGAVGATLFALTGGLVAPGIAAGLAAVVGTSAIAAGVSTALTSAAAITTIFGVGGAGLASYKMHRRTKGLTEFNFNKEEVGGKDSDAELFSTVCISGWLRDTRDFQRP
ncbi:hypothetical protein ACHAWU_005715, partial [Discostella pseudostelligera]